MTAPTRPHADLRRTWRGLGVRLAAIALLLVGACETPDLSPPPVDHGPPPRDGPPLHPLPAMRSCLAGVALGDGPATQMPAVLSATGCFSDVAALTMADDVVPYDVNSPLWTDGALKDRFIVLPPGELIVVQPNGTLEFPTGTVLIKTFLMLEDDRRADSLRALETRFLVRGTFDWGFFTYRFREDGSDADLLTAGADEEMSIRRDGERLNFTYHYPSRIECNTCHSSATERSLGFRVDQLNRDFNYTGVVENQLVAMDSVGMFFGLDGGPGDWPRLVDPMNEGEDDEARARSYLHANCSHCHRPLGQSSPGLTLDMRVEQSLEDTHLCDPAQFFAPPGTLRVDPGDPDASFIVQRMESTDPLVQMPPLGRSLPDHEGGLRAVRGWIARITNCP